MNVANSRGRSDKSGVRSTGPASRHLLPDIFPGVGCSIFDWPGRTRASREGLLMTKTAEELR